MQKMLRSTTPSLQVTQSDSYDNEKGWCSISLESEKLESITVDSVIEIDLNPITTSVEISKAVPCLSTTTTQHHRVRQEGSDSTIPFTFRCRPRSFPASLITPPVPADPLLSCATSTPSNIPTTTTTTKTESVPLSTSKPNLLNGAGPSITEIEDSFIACTIEPPTRESYATLSKRRFGFDTSLSNIQYGYSGLKPYRFTSPLSPDPKIRKRSKCRRHKPKSAPCSLLQKTLRRTHADALRKRYPPSPPSYEFLPSLDEDDEDEFDDDEDDEIIDDFDTDGDAQVDDIVDLYNQPSSEQEMCSGYTGIHGGGLGPVKATETLIHISTTIMTNPTGLEPDMLKPVLEETGAFVYVAHSNSDY